MVHLVGPAPQSLLTLVGGAMLGEWAADGVAAKALKLNGTYFGLMTSKSRA